MKLQHLNGNGFKMKSTDKEYVVAFDDIQKRIRSIRRMTNPNKRKGDKAEREAAELLTEVTGFECKRNLAAGIPDDVGDIYGIPNCVIQVADYKDKSRACLVKPREVETQRKNAGVDFVASMVRFRGGQWRMVLTPEQFNTLLQAALQ